MIALITFWFGWLLATTVVVLHVLAARGHCRRYVTVRAYLDRWLQAFFTRVFLIVLAMPRSLQRVRTYGVWMVQKMLLFAARTVASFERRLRQLSLRLSHHRAAVGAKPRSPFLSQIHAHKNSLRVSHKKV